MRIINEKLGKGYDHSREKEGDNQDNMEIRSQESNKSKSVNRSLEEAVQR